MIEWVKVLLPAFLTLIGLIIGYRKWRHEVEKDKEAKSVEKLAKEQEKLALQAKIDKEQNQIITAIHTRIDNMGNLILSNHSELTSSINVLGRLVQDMY